MRSSRRERGGDAEDPSTTKTSSKRAAVRSTLFPPCAGECRVRRAQKRRERRTVARKSLGRDGLSRSADASPPVATSRLAIPIAASPHRSERAPGRATFVAIRGAMRAAARTDRRASWGQRGKSTRAASRGHARRPRDPRARPTSRNRSARACPLREQVATVDRKWTRRAGATFAKRRGSQSAAANGPRARRRHSIFRGDLHRSGSVRASHIAAQRAALPRAPDSRCPPDTRGPSAKWGR